MKKLAALVLSVFWCISADAQISNTDGDRTYFAVDSAASSSTSRGAFNDNVDPYSGALSVTIPLGIPIQGLESLALMYKRTTAWRSVLPDTNGTTIAGPYASWRVTWAPTVTPITYTYSCGAFGCASQFEAMSVDLPDGRTEYLHRLSSSGGYPIFQSTFLSASGWKIIYTQNNSVIEQPSGIPYSEFTMYSPEGTVYQYGPGIESFPTPSGGLPPFTVKRAFVFVDIRSIRYASGHTLTYSVSRPSVPNCSNPVQVYDLGFLRSAKNIRITSSNGDFVDIQLPWGTTCSTNRTGTIALNGSVVSTINFRDITTAELGVSDRVVAELVLATGQATRFSYVRPASPRAGSVVLDRVDLGTGGWVRYLHRTPSIHGDPVFFGTRVLEETNNPVIVRSIQVAKEAEVMRRETSDGLVTTYSYDRAIGHNDAYPNTYRPRYGQPDYVTVSDNIGRTAVHSFRGLGSVLVPGLGLEGCAQHTIAPCGYPLAMDTGGVWTIGLPLSFSEAGSTTTYEWVPQSLGLPGAGYSTILMSRVQIYDETIYAARLARKTTTRDGLTYQTIYSNYDAFGSAATIEEIGPGGSRRTTTRTFDYDFAKNILTRVATESTVMTAQ